MIDEVKDIALITNRPLEPGLLLSENFKWLWESTVERERKSYESLLLKDIEEITDFVKTVHEFVERSEKDLDNVYELLAKFPYVNLPQDFLQQYPDEKLFKLYFANNIYIPIMIKSMNDVLTGLIDMMKVGARKAVVQEGDRRSESIMFIAKEMLFDLGFSALNVCPKGDPSRMTKEVMAILESVFSGKRLLLHSCTLTTFLAGRKNEGLASALKEYIEDEKLYDLERLVDALNSLDWEVLGILLKEAYDLSLNYVEGDVDAFAWNIFSRSVDAVVNAVKGNVNDLTKLIADANLQKNTNISVMMRGVTLAPYYFVQDLIDEDPKLTATNWNFALARALKELESLK